METPACFYCKQTLTKKYLLNRKFNPKKNTVSCLVCGCIMHGQCFASSRLNDPDMRPLNCPQCAFGLKERDGQPILFPGTPPEKAMGPAHQAAKKAVQKHAREFRPAVSALAKEVESRSPMEDLPSERLREIMYEQFYDKVLRTAQRIFAKCMYPRVLLPRDLRDDHVKGRMEILTRVENLPTVLFTALADKFWDEAKELRQARLQALDASACEERMARFKKIVENRARDKAQLYEDCPWQFPYIAEKQHRIAAWYRAFYEDIWIHSMLDKMSERKCVRLEDRAVLKSMYKPLSAQLLKEMCQIYDQTAENEFDDMYWAMDKMKRDQMNAKSCQIARSFEDDMELDL